MRDDLHELHNYCYYRRIRHGNLQINKKGEYSMELQTIYIGMDCNQYESHFYIRDWCLADGE